MKQKLLFSTVTVAALSVAGIAFQQAHAAQRTLPVNPVKERGPGKEGVVQAARISPALQTKLNTIGLADSAGVVLVSFNTSNGLAGVSNLATLLATNSVVPAARLEATGIISAVLTKQQVLALAADTRVKSLWDNYRLYYSLHQARILCGVDKLRGDAGMTALNGGHVVDGSGAGDASPNANPYPSTPQPNRSNITVVVIDSGIDTTGAPNPGLNRDLEYDNSSVGVLNANIPPNGYTVPPTIPATKVIQNIQVNGDNVTGTITYSENQLNNDTVGHGSHCSGIVGSLGSFSRNVPATTGPNATPLDPNAPLTTEDFSGVANGVKIIGCGSGAGLFVLDALGGMEYSINFRQFYNIRVTSNSYGSIGTYDPTDPLNVAIKTAHDNGIITVFAAGNSGPGVDTISDSSKSPYVISVAAGTKEGGLVGFSSRGKPSGERTVGGIDEFNLPAITAPGTGREFDFNTPGNPNGKGFYSDMISTLSKLVGAAHGTNDQEFPAPYQANYTQISGTSMACPFIAGTCALILDANPSLTPDQVKAVLQATATHMPDYLDHEVGAGYVNVFAAVDLALNPAKPYKPFNRIEAPYAASYPPFITQVSNANIPPPSGRPIQQAPAVSPGSPYPPPTPDNTGGHENLVLPFQPSSVSAADYNAAKTKAQTADNSYAFLVDANTDGTPISPIAAADKTGVLDVRIQFGNDSAAGVAGGNSIGLLLWAPDGTSYSSGIALPVLDSPTRQVVVKNPVPGLWVAELRGIRGLAAVPVTPPTGAGLPDTTTGQIYRQNLNITNPPTDANNIPQSDAINFALLNHYLDQRSSGTFDPTGKVTRGDFVQVIADNMPLRQSLKSAASAYTDATGNQARLAEAAAQYGSTLRDFDFTAGPTLPTNATTFTPASQINRMQAAAAMVRALGLDKEAQNLAGTAVRVTYQGNAIDVVDANLLPSDQRGYLQLALNRGLITFVPRLKADNVTYEAVATPTKSLTRGDLAVNIVNFRNTFRAGNTLAMEELMPQTP